MTIAGVAQSMTIRFIVMDRHEVECHIQIMKNRCYFSRDYLLRYPCEPRVDDVALYVALVVFMGRVVNGRQRRSTHGVLLVMTGSVSCK